MRIHGHHHHDHALPAAGPDRRLILSLALTVVFAAVEATTGWWSGSLTLLGDAGHMVTDGVALGLAAAAGWLAQRPPSPRHSYGLGRAEVIAALINGVVMLLVIVGIAIEAVARLRHPEPVTGGAVMVVAALGLVVNGLVAWILSRGHTTLNTRAALLHVLGDLLGSVAALAAGTIIYVTGWTPIDPLLALGVVLLILISTVRLLQESLHVVMEGVPVHLSLTAIGQAMAETERVESVHDLHVWTLSSGTIALTAHVVLADLRDWTTVQPALAHLLQERFHIDHLTLQPESSTHILHPLTGRPS